MGTKQPTVDESRESVKDPPLYEERINIPKFVPFHNTRDVELFREALEMCRNSAFHVHSRPPRVGADDVLSVEKGVEAALEHKRFSVDIMKKSFWKPAPSRKVRQRARRKRGRENDAEDELYEEPKPKAPEESEVKEEEEEPVEENEVDSADEAYGARDLNDIEDGEGEREEEGEYEAVL